VFWFSSIFSLNHYCLWLHRCEFIPCCLLNTHLVFQIRGFLPLLWTPLVTGLALVVQVLFLQPGLFLNNSVLNFAIISCFCSMIKVLASCWFGNGRVSPMCSNSKDTSTTWTLWLIHLMVSILLLEGMMGRWVF